MSQTWALWDYGVGNLHSLRRALERAGATVIVTQDPDAFLAAHVAVLPGVGAFGAVMDSLEPVAAGLRQRHQEGRPILGVCIGQQILHEGSDEDPDHAGLGLLPGRVTRLPASAGKIPHMGWNTIGEDAAGIVAAAAGQHVYYVHSYAAPVATADPTTVLATTDYGEPFVAAERLGNTVGCQFHPEKSGAAGARILEALIQEWGA